MSANNYVRVSKYHNPPKFVLTDADAETDVGVYVNQCDTLEEAVLAAEQYCRFNPVEYGIRFEGFNV